MRQLQAVTETVKENPMRTIKLAKVTVHINVGKSGEMLEKARKVLRGNYWAKALH